MPPFAMSVTWTGYSIFTGDADDNWTKGEQKMGLMEELKRFRHIPDEAVRLFEYEYTRVLDIDKDNWAEAKEAAEKAILHSKYRDVYADAMFLYLGEKAKARPRRADYILVL